MGGTGCILIQESGTEPAIRVMVETENHDTCERYVDQALEVIKRKGRTV